MNNKQKIILVVDDSRQMLITIREELEGGGYHVVEAKDGFEGLVLVAQKPFPDLITLDIEMPKMDGFETCKKFRHYVNKTKKNDDDCCGSEEECDDSCSCGSQEEDQ